MDVTRSGLKKKAAKKKRRLRPNLNPNFGKKAASNSVVAEPGAEAGGPKQPRAPPKPTGGGSDTTISESNALAAVGGLDIDNWDNNEDGHLLALTNDKGNPNPDPEPDPDPDPDSDPNPGPNPNPNHLFALTNHKANPNP